MTNPKNREELIEAVKLRTGLPGEFVSNIIKSFDELDLNKPRITDHVCGMVRQNWEGYRRFEKRRLLHLVCKAFKSRGLKLVGASTLSEALYVGSPQCKKRIRIACHSPIYYSSYDCIQVAVGNKFGGANYVVLTENDIEPVVEKVLQENCIRN